MEFWQGQNRRGGFHIRPARSRKAARAHIECAPTAAEQFRAACIASVYYIFIFISYLFSRNEVCQLQQLKQKKIPVRRCVGCNAQRPKRELVRVVRSPEGEISIDLRGKAPGRGAYLCPSAACLAKARKAKRLERTFEVPIPDGIYDRLTEEIACAEQSAKEAASHE